MWLIIAAAAVVINAVAYFAIVPFFDGLDTH